MKNRFGNVTYDSTLSQGLCPAVQEPDTLAHTSGFSFEFQDGVTFTDSVSFSMPSVLAASLVQVVQYVDRNFTDTVSASMPQVMAAELVSVATYVSRNIDSDSVSMAMPIVQAASLVEVVRIHTLYDEILDRPEDTLQHTNSWEFTLT